VANRVHQAEIARENLRGKPGTAAIVDLAMSNPVTIRAARTADVPPIRKLIDANVDSGRLLSKATVTLYEDIQEFCVAEMDGLLAGCGAVHVLWDDLAEIRTVAVRDDCQGRGVGHVIVDFLIDRCRALGVARVFVLTFAVDFFASHGFQPINGTPVDPEVYRELLRSYDEGVAEFLDLERVKPNTLGNVRMLRYLLLGRGNEHTRCARAESSELSPSLQGRYDGRPGSTDAPAGSLRGLHHRLHPVGAPSAGAEAPGRQGPVPGPGVAVPVKTYQ
jgi:amino-acid N-acetyltransferase